MTFGIIGFGDFGKLLAEILGPHGQILAHDRRLSDSSSSYKSVEFSEAAGCDVVILATGIESYGKICERLAGEVNQNTLVVDVCSVKVEPVNILQKYLEGKCRLLATHPLFGRRAVSEQGLAGQKIAVCPIDKSGYDTSRAFLENTLQLEIIELSPKEHDKEMAWVHGLTFYLGRGLLQLNLPKSPLATAYYQKLIEIVEFEKGHSMELFRTIEAGNPYAAEVRRRLLVELNTIESELEK